MAIPTYNYSMTWQKFLDGRVVHITHGNMRFLAIALGATFEQVDVIKIPSQSDGVSVLGFISIAGQFELKRIVSGLEIQLQGTNGTCLPEEFRIRLIQAMAEAGYVLKH